MLLVEATDDGSFLLRPAGVYPDELYSDARVGEDLLRSRAGLDCVLERIGATFRV